MTARGQGWDVRGQDGKEGFRKGRKGILKKEKERGGQGGKDGGMWGRKGPYGKEGAIGKGRCQGEGRIQGVKEGATGGMKGPWEKGRCMWKGARERGRDHGARKGQGEGGGKERSTKLLILSYHD